MMPDSAISIAGLEKRYGDVLALASVSLDVGPAEMFGLIGPDGAGKTTLIRILTSLMDPDAGQCRILGIAVKEHPEKIRTMIGYMPQRFSLYPDLTVGENLRFFADLFRVPRAERIKRTGELLEFARLTPFVKRRAGQLSGGMKQKLALCCALIHTPRVLVLDEPTTGVDPVSRREFWEILGRLKQQGVAILVTTPYMDEAEKCDRIALIHKGRILAAGAAGDVISRHSGRVAAIYGPDTPAIAQWLKKRLEPARVRILGDRVHAGLYGSVSEDPASFQEAAAADGIRIDAVRDAAPGLEDAFVALIHETEKGAT